MTTQYQAACRGEITPEMARVAEREGSSPEAIRAEVAEGRLVIPANKRHLGQEGSLDPMGIGRAITTKINANIGASPVRSSIDEELAKLDWAVQFGADTVMDLSTGGRLDETRERLISHSTVPIGTVPIYEMIVGRRIEDLTHKEILACIEKQAEQGVDFFTLHAGVLREHLPLAARRLAGMVSRGGTLLARWMTYHSRQNPMYELFDEISAIMREYDVAYSLGDGMRPGCLADASDEAQFAELRTLAELVFRARAAGVQVIVEGPGHVPFDKIEHNMKLQAELCDGAPFYVLGPIVTDVAPGYDHITSAIGATAAAYHGASFLCYVTPKEHLGLPRLEDVRAGVVAYKIAAHAADVARDLPGARQWDDEISRARAALDWSKHFALAMDPEMARELHDADTPKDADFCAMCGHAWCAVRMSKAMKDWKAGKETDGLEDALARLSPPELEFLHRRRGLAPCHSAVTADAEEARAVQKAVTALQSPDDCECG
ncbi:MAG: phosphomethylpyrimidine synthase ThiC [Phycisphaerae bacterium]|nr:phosphomethylpyrimidine synthase ThiC [Phycisphaerae bacterium]